MLRCSAGFVVIVGHLHRNEPIVRAVDEQHRHGAVRHGIQSGIFPGANVDPFFTVGVHQALMQAIIQMQVVPGNMAPDGIRGCKTAVGNDPAYIFRQFHTGSHHHRTGPHRDPRQIDWEAASRFAIDPIDPLPAIMALQQAKADVMSLALSVATLFGIQHNTVIFVPKVCDHPKIPGPVGTPAVHSDDDPLWRITPTPMSHQYKAVLAHHANLAALGLQLTAQIIQLPQQCHIPQTAGDPGKPFFIGIDPVPVQGDPY